MYVAVNKNTVDGKDYFNVIDSDDLSVDVIDKESIREFVRQTNSRIRWFPYHNYKDYNDFIVVYPKNGRGTVYVQTCVKIIEICQVPDKFSFSGKVYNSVLDLRITLEVSGNKIVRLFSVSNDCIEDVGTWRLDI